MNLLYPLRSRAQGDQTKITVKLAPGATTGAWLHLPDDYKSTSTSYPLIIFIHGLGEQGTDLNKVLAHGLPKIISQGAKMQYTVGGKLFKFITVSPQIPNGWASEGMVQNVIDDIRARYRVDANRIYITGLSAGGYGTLNYVAAGTTYASKVAAIVPVSTAAIDKTNGLCNISSSGVASWFLCGTSDGFINNQKNYITQINGCSPKYPAIGTSYAGGAHNDYVWDRAYDAGHTYQNPNIYEWMLKYSRGTQAAVPAPVAAVAAEKIAITLPVNSTTLDGSASTASGSTIASYTWTTASGPSTPTYSSTSAAKTTVSKLVAGTYVFTLTVKNAAGGSASKQVTVTVTAAAVPVPVVGIVASNVTLPANTTTLDGSTSTAPNSTISSYSWSLASGPSTPTYSSTSAAKITVSKLVAGSYTFKLTVKNSAGGSATKQATVKVTSAATGNTGAAAGCGSCKFLITPGTDGGAYINGTTLKAQPGDTVCIQGGNYKYIQFFNFTGTAAKPIIFKNCGSQVKIGNGGTYGFIFNNVKYFKVLGNGSSDKYGFSVNGVSAKLNVGLAMGKGCTDYEAGNIEITNCEVGVMAKVNPDCETANQYPYFAIRNVSLHDIYVHDVTGEGFYVGNTAPNGTSVVCNGVTKNVLPPRIYGLKIYNCITANTGWDGIQVASAPTGVEIYNNKVSNYGTVNKGSQQAGIILGGESNGRVYNNTVTKGTGNGIEVFGIGLCYVYNNIISDAGWDGSSQRQDALFIDDRPTKNNYVPQYVYVFNNTVVNSGRDGIRQQNSYGTVAAGNLFYNNLVVAPGSLSSRGSLSYISNQAGIKFTSSNNLTYATIAEAKFVDAAGKNFHLAAGSPAIDKGKDLSGYFKFDIDNQSRPQGAGFDVGADEVSGSAPANKAPVASAGSNVTITLPVATTTLDASGSSDADGTIASYAWTQVSGPVTTTIASAATAKPVITKLSAAGIYVFRVTVKDNDGATATDDVTVTVKAASTNKAPTANAGGNVSITLPATTAQLSGSDSKDPDGDIASYAWSQVSGPVTALLSSTSAVNPSANKLTEAGTYVFKLTVTDNDGATATDQVTVTVKSASANKAPVANTGSNVTITLPATTAQLSGSGSTDSDGTITSYSWTQVSGPITALLSSTSAVNPSANKLSEAGTYVFKLTVTDNDGATGSDQVTVTVKAATNNNKSPVANAGSNLTITLPATTAQLSGSASNDPDGTIASYVWTQVSGPITALLSSSSAVNPSANKLSEAGTYVFRLTVTDNDGATANDQVTVTVKAATATKPPTSTAPVANAGGAVTIAQPRNSIDATAAASTDTDGKITDYLWTQVSGPTTASIVSPRSVKTDLNRLTYVGVYVFRLIVTNDKGQTATDDLKVTVDPNPSNVLVANAGADREINYPSANTTTLDGSASYSNNSYISQYAWTVVSGTSGGASILNTSAQKPVVSFSAAGTYVIRLTITDTYGNTSTDDVTVIAGPKSGIMSTETVNASIAIYPNPVVSTLRLNLKLQTATNIVARIFNSNGQLKATYNLGTISSIQKDIDVNSLTPGLYILQITDGRQMELSNKFIKN